MPYSASWPVLFEQEAARLHAALSRWLVGDVEHVGSTAVPGLAAKPVLDMLAPVADVEAAREAVPALVDLGYRHADHRDRTRRCGSTRSTARSTRRGRTSCT